jgi:hypothetical protein
MRRTMFTRKNKKLIYIAVLTTALLLALTSIAMAAVWTDQADYSPGSVVTISGDNRDGAGYLAGETVHVDVAGPNGYVASCEGVADSEGAWSCTVTLWDNYLAVGEYSYTATGQTSKVSQSGTFTDACHITLSPTSGPTGTTVTLTSGGSCFIHSSTITITFDSSTVSTSPALCSSNSGGNIVGCNFLVPNKTSGDYTVSASDGTNTSSETFTITAPSCAAPSVTTNPSNQIITYGADATFSAAASGSPTPSVQWEVSTDGGTNWSTVSGETNTTLTVTSPTVAMSGYKYHAVFTNECGGTQTATTEAATLTVLKADADCTVTGYSGTYDAVAHGATGSCTGIGGVTLGGLDLGASFTNVPGGTANWSFSNANYNDQSGSVNITINKRDATWTTNPNSKTYGDADPSPLTTGSGSNFVTSDGVTATYSRAAGETVASSPYHITATLSPAGVLGNYNIANDGADFTINKRILTATITVADKYFDYTTSATITGCTMNNVVDSETVGCDYSGATANINNALAGDDKPVTATGLAMSGDAVVLANYSFDGNGSGTGNILHWSIEGFYQPVDMDGVINVVKGGSTVPLKFEIFAGSTEITDVEFVGDFTTSQIVCGTGVVEDTIETLATGGTSLRYDPVAGQFIFNWKTPKNPGKCYQVTLTFDDGSSLVAYFRLK